MSDTLLSNAAPEFICDVHLGKLARRLRLLGFDTIYRNDLEDEEIIRIARTDDRIILTRDGEILNNKYSPAEPGVFSGEIKLLGVIARIQFFQTSRFGKCCRCSICEDRSDLFPGA